MTPWAGGSFGTRARCLLAPNPGMMTLDGTNTWVLQEPGASASVVVDPGPIEDGHLERLDRRARRRRPGAAHPPPLRPLRGGGGVRAPQGLRGAGARPGVLRRRRPAGRRRGRSTSTGWRCGCSPRPGHTADSISFVLPAERRAADRRHGARPRHDGRRPPRRPARARTSTRSSGCASLAASGEVARALAGARPGARRRPRRPRPLPRPPPRAARPGRGAPSRELAVPLRPSSPRTPPCRARSSRSSTPTSTSPSGAPPSGRSAPSWPTSPPVESGLIRR